MIVMMRGQMTLLPISSLRWLCDRKSADPAPVYCIFLCRKMAEVVSSLDLSNGDAQNVAVIMNALVKVEVVGNDEQVIA